jgi:hypothetical protein
MTSSNTRNVYVVVWGHQEGIQAVSDVCATKPLAEERRDAVWEEVKDRSGAFADIKKREVLQQ